MKPLHLLVERYRVPPVPGNVVDGSEVSRGYNHASRGFGINRGPYESVPRKGPSRVPILRKDTVIYRE